MRAAIDPPTTKQVASNASSHGAKTSPSAVATSSNAASGLRVAGSGAPGDLVDVDVGRAVALDQCPAGDRSPRPGRRGTRGDGSRRPGGTSGPEWTISPSARNALPIPVPRVAPTTRRLPRRGACPPFAHAERIGVVDESDRPGGDAELARRAASAGRRRKAPRACARATRRLARSRRAPGTAKPTDRPRRRRRRPPRR